MLEFGLDHGGHRPYPAIGLSMEIGMRERVAKRPCQAWSAETYGENASFVPKLGMGLLETLNARSGEEILDLGCGDGALTEQIVATGAQVLGIDLSEDMLRAARQRGLSVQRLDAERLAFDGRFDGVFSNAVLHWIEDPERVISGVYRALRPGGRFVGEFGGYGNVAAIVTALLAAREMTCPELERIRNPWFYPTAEQFGTLLTANGFELRSCTLVPRPTPLPTGIEGWLNTFAAPFLDGADHAEREKILATAVRLLAPSLRDHQGAWSADYVRLKFHAVRP